MKLIISLSESTARRAHYLKRPLALWHLAGGTFLSHVLGQLSSLLAEAEILVAATPPTAVEAWLRDQHPNLRITFLAREAETGMAGVISQVRHHLATDDLLLIEEDMIVSAAFARLTEGEADIACVVGETGASGTLDLTQDGHLALSGEGGRWRPVSLWLRAGANNLDLLERAGGQAGGLGVFAVNLLQQGEMVAGQRADFALRVSDPEALLQANARLLGLGYGSADAVERSYAEEFTVLPPVYLHDSATVENAVIGPYVSAAAGAVLRDCVVANTIVEAGASLESCVLYDSLVGQESVIQARPLRLHADDGACIGPDGDANGG